MDEEMMAVLGAAATTDPVSGNNVPPGSMPEEVRDDIDARLSEGEYVVPADVVRYFGVRVFEDMRKEAKIGLAQMDADGRIGGKPPTEQPMGNEAISDDEVELLESMLSSQGLAAGGLAKGGMLDKLINAATTDPMVNSRLQAAGMAVGGVVGQKMPTQSLYSDPKKVDSVIAKIASAAQQNPDLMRILGERGITVPTVTATQTPEQMATANSPKKTTNPVMKDAKASTISAYTGTLAYPNMPNTSNFIPSASGPISALAPYAMGPGVSTVLGAAGAMPPITTDPVPLPTPGPTTPNCGPNAYWDGVQCVAIQKNDDDDDIEPIPVTHWYDDIDLNDPINYIDSTIEGEEEDKGFIGNIIGNTGIGKMMKSVDVLTNVARMNASLQLSVASNQMTQEEADEQIKKINGYAKSNGVKQSTVDRWASGTKFAAKNKKDADKMGDGDGTATPTEIADWMNKQSGTTPKTVVDPIVQKPDKSKEGSKHGPYTEVGKEVTESFTDDRRKKKKSNKNLQAGQASGSSQKSAQKVIDKSTKNVSGVAAKAKNKKATIAENKKVQEKIKNRLKTGSGGFNKGGLMERK
tara:strand:+ start:5445 stop:7184 length:1740 start_codon:yes stop_codon:yes gene_type:complete